MTHPRNELRDALKALLVAAATDAGSRVYTNRSELLHGHEDGSELPALLVSFVGESSRLVNEAPKQYWRAATFAIDVFTNDAGDEADADADALAEQVEVAMFAAGDQFLEALTAQHAPSEYAGTDPAYLSMGGRDIAFLRVKWTFTYVSEAPEVQTAGQGVQDFETAHTEFDVSELDPSTKDGGEDDVALPIA